MLVTVLLVVMPGLCLRTEETLCIEVCVENKNSGDDDQASASRQNIGCSDLGSVGGINSGDGNRASVDRQNSGAGGWSSDCGWTRLQGLWRNMQSRIKQFLFIPRALFKLRYFRGNCTTNTTFVSVHAFLFKSCFQVFFLEILWTENHCLECTSQNYTTLQTFHTFVCAKLSF